MFRILGIMLAEYGFAGDEQVDMKRHLFSVFEKFERGASRKLAAVGGSSEYPGFSKSGALIDSGVVNGGV